jgi:uncharacterized membrane protein
MQVMSHIAPILKNAVRMVRSVLWFRPAVFSFFAILIAVTIAAIDTYVRAEVFSWLPPIPQSATDGLLRLMAGSMLTVTTVALSVLMLVLSLSAGQASPRVVPELMADEATQNALGTFVATFVFALAAMLLIGMGGIHAAGITLTFFVTLLLAIAAIGYLVYWIHHVADSLKLTRITNRVFKQAEATLDAYLRKAGTPDAVWRETKGPPDFEVRPNRTGYIQLVDGDQLDELVQSCGMRIDVAVQEGDFVHPECVLIRANGEQELDDEIIGQLRDAVVIGAERSAEGDPLLGFELLAEIGCRALSPGINDPQTAITCIGYIGSLLARAAKAPPEDYPGPVTSSGKVRLPRPQFENFLKRAIRPLVRDGAASTEVVAAILDILVNLAGTGAEPYRKALGAEGQRTLEYATARLELASDKKAIEEKGRDLQRRLAGPVVA